MLLLYIIFIFSSFTIPLKSDQSFFFGNSKGSCSESLDAKKDNSIKSKKQKIVKRLLYAQPFIQGYHYLMHWYDWHELAISDYLTLFDRTHTAFGPWGLEQLTKPIDDVGVIKQRQEGIAKIDQDEQLFNKVCCLLDDIKLLEDSFLVYYDEHDQLHDQAKQLYYSYLKTVLNKNKIALDYAYLFDSCNALVNLATLLCVNGLISEFVSAQAEGKSLDFVQGFKNSFKKLFHDHSLSDTNYQKLKAENRFSTVSARSSDATASSDWLPKVAVSGLKSLNDFACNAKKGLCNPAVTRTLFQGSFGDKWSFFKEQCGWASPFAFAWVLGQVAYQDYRLWLSVKRNYNRLMFLYKTHIELQHRLCDVARFIEKIDQLQETVSTIPALYDHKGFRRLRLLLKNENIQKLKALLQAPTFCVKRNIFYSRGHVLITHAFLHEVKELLLPMIQAVGLVDGFISVVRLFHEYKDHPEHPFCFADIDLCVEPKLDIVDGWLPLIKNNHVLNSISLGNNAFKNLLLTGPNGGGKSTLLKLIGGAVVLAHSWGIVPAQACRMSLFAGLRTSFNPQEDVTKGISTFMAQKKRLDELKKYVQTSQVNKCYLFLVDEPYRGTVEIEAEKRAYQFGKYMAEHKQVMLAMASHLQKPIHLQSDTGIFKNMHMHIALSDDGAFERTFKLLDGPAWWWFTDIDRRMSFIDWLHPDS